MKRAWLTVVLLVGLFVPAPSAAQPVTALAPFDTWASGLGHLRGAVADADGNVYVSDRSAGTVVRITPSQQQTIVASGLDRPAGLAFDLQGHLLIAEENAGRVVRLEPNGTKTTLASSMKQPRWLAMHESGTLFIAARALTGDGSSSDNEGNEPEMILKLTPDGQLSVFVQGFNKLQGIAANHVALYAATQGFQTTGNADGVVYQVVLQPDGSAGAVTQLGPADQFKKPVGITVDRLGAIYISTKELTLDDDKSKRVIAKLHASGQLTLFAQNLDDPHGIAFDADGNLYLADGNAGRVLRFRPPPPPTVTAPEFTTEALLTLTGTTEPGARVDVFLGEATVPVSVLADGSGQFSVEVTLDANTVNELEVYATPHGGHGLTSNPAEVTVTHDNVPVSLVFQAPPAGAFVRQSVSVEAQASDAGSHVATLTLSVGAQPLSATLAPEPPAPSVTASALWDTTTTPDGTATLVADATDRAGNTAAVSRSVIVDNTPPETTITGGPTVEIGTPSATFEFTGTDNLTPEANLEFAWRLDGGPFSAFSSATTATVPGLTEGPHTFEVKVRDLAGNEDPTPATRAFSVRFGPSITGVDPASGTIGTFVTITGAGFAPGATTIAFNGIAAVVHTATATSLTAVVPTGATTGPLVVTTAQGTATIAFTVTLTGDFTLTASPAAPATVRIIAGDEGFASIQANGTGTFTTLVSLSVTGAPSGVTTGLSPQLVARGGGAFLGLAVAPSVTPGTYPLTVTGQAQLDAQSVTRMTAVQLEVLPPGTQAITGRVLTAEAVPEPIPGVTITLGTAFTLTDAAGNFVLLSPPSGANMLVVDGRTASTPEAQYPPVEIQIDVAASGPTRVPFNLYLPKIDTANAITLPLDATGATTQTVEATTPRIPGLVVTIPQGTKITGHDGNPVSQITITPVPVDRSPMPFPPGVSPPMLFTIQPGGAVPSTPLPITFPNLRQDPAGEQNDLYFFDLVAGAWDVWGQGTVSEDGTQVVSNAGAGLPRFAWHTPACGCAGDSPGAGHHARAGDPVDLVTGRFVVSKTDLVLPGRLSVVIERSYRSGASNDGLFGTAWTLETYDSQLLRVGTSMRLITGDQASYLFTPSGSGQWINLTEPAYQGAVITQLPGDFIFQIRYKDGTIHRYDRIFGFGNLAALAHIADRYGNAITITREQVNQRNKITRITEPGGRSHDLEYDAAHRIIAIRDSINREVRYTYDGLGRLETVTDAAGGITRYTYDAANRITAITDPRNITYLTNHYDAAGRVIRQVQADQGEWTFAYAFQGATNTQTVVTDPRGHATTHRFDSQGFTVSVTDALGQTTAFEYEPGSNLLLAQIDPLGRRTAYTYDAAGNVTSITRLAGTPAVVTTSFTYEPVFQNLKTITNPLNHTTTFTYDAAGNLITITDPLQHQTTLTYNPAGQPVTITTPATATTPAATTTLVYANGDLVEIIDPLGHTTTRGLDAVGRLVTLIDPRGRVTRYHYDALNQLTHLVDTLGGLTRLAYDPNGNLLSLTDARGHTTGYAYDAMDRLEVRTDPLLRPETFAYDPAGNLTARTDRKGQGTVSTYDPLGRLIHVAYDDASTTSYTWDAGGRLSQVADSIAGTITRSYDDLDRLVLETTPNGAVSYTYDAAGRRASMTVAGQPTVGYGYDAADRLLTITQGTAIVGFTYDEANRRTSLTLPNGVKTEYAYEVASRLTGLTFRNESAVLGTLTYAYDAAGNRVAVGGTWARTGLPQALASATYDSANRQLSVGATALTYDHNGNLVDDGTTTYAWDARDRLAGLGGAASASFVYDALGRRQRKTINGVTTEFVYDGLNPVLQGGGATTADLLTGLGIDEFFGRTEGAAPEYFLADALGSTVALTDATGALLTEYSYEPFGAVTANGASSGNELRYTGREDDGTGLYYYRARYYHQTLRRFVQEDPVGWLGGVNFYAYAGHNPITFIDPLGLAACQDFVRQLITAWSAQKTGVDLGTHLFENRANRAIRPSDSSGFRPALVAGGQGAAVAHHVYGHAGLVLMYGPEGAGVSRVVGLFDYVQRFFPGRTRAESEAELADNAAGRQVGKALRSAYGAVSKCQGRAQLESDLEGILCEPVP